MWEWRESDDGRSKLKLQMVWWQRKISDNAPLAALGQRWRSPVGHFPCYLRLAGSLLGVFWASEFFLVDQATRATSVAVERPSLPLHQRHSL